MSEFEIIYSQYLKQVYRFLLKLCGDPSIAEELTQDTFAIAFEKLDEFRGTCKMSVWLCQIAKHEYFAYYRKHKNQVSDSGVEVHIHQETDTLEQRMIDADDRIRIHEILHKLPEPYKEVFTLRVMGELPFKEIGRLFQKSENWAKVTYYRAKCTIIEQLGGVNDEKM